MPYKFEKLEIWQLTLGYIDLIYEIAGHLPATERYNLNGQMRRAATSIALNVAEVSTGQSNADQARFLDLASRALLETVACQHLIHRRGYIKEPEMLRETYRQSTRLFAKFQAFKAALVGDAAVWVEAEPYELGEETPF